MSEVIFFFVFKLEDGNWYRAVVQNVTSDGNVRVSFVDYGNTEDVPRDNIRQISSSFLKLPFQAIKCWLSGESYFLLQELLHLETCCFGGRRWWQGMLCRTLFFWVCLFAFSSLSSSLEWSAWTLLTALLVKRELVHFASSVMLSGFWFLPS